MMSTSSRQRSSRSASWVNRPSRTRAKALEGTQRRILIVLDAPPVCRPQLGASETDELGEVSVPEQLRGRPVSRLENVDPAGYGTRLV
jgi:hypothetical protein